MAINTTNTILEYSTDGGTVYNKLVDIVGYPDLGASPTKLDTTNLTATKFKTSILGLQEIPDLTFECNYDETAFNTINGLDDSYYFKLKFDTNGEFTWQGQISIFANGGGVDEVRKMTVTLSASTPLVFA